MQTDQAIRNELDNAKAHYATIHPGDARERLKTAVAIYCFSWVLGNEVLKENMPFIKKDIAQVQPSKKA